MTSEQEEAKREKGEETKGAQLQEEGEAAKETAPPSGGAGKEGEEAQKGEPRQPVDVFTVLRFCISQLAAAAWQKMGLQADPLTNEIHKDIEQARVAIDCTAALVEKLKPKLEGQELRDYESLLTDLRLNFLNQSK